MQENHLRDSEGTMESVAALFATCEEQTGKVHSKIFAVGEMRAGEALSILEFWAEIGDSGEIDGFSTC